MRLQVATGTSSISATELFRAHQSRTSSKSLAGKGTLRSLTLMEITHEAKPNNDGRSNSSRRTELQVAACEVFLLMTCKKTRIRALITVRRIPKALLR